MTHTERTSENSVYANFAESPECELPLYGVLRSSQRQAMTGRERGYSVRRWRVRPPGSTLGHYCTPAGGARAGDGKEAVRYGVTERRRSPRDSNQGQPLPLRLGDPRTPRGGGATKGPQNLRRRRPQRGGGAGGAKDARYQAADLRQPRGRHAAHGGLPAARAGPTAQGPGLGGWGSGAGELQRHLLPRRTTRLTERTGQEHSGHRRARRGRLGRLTTFPQRLFTEVRGRGILRTSPFGDSPKFGTASSAL